jgi:hypothetical protein
VRPEVSSKILVFDGDCPVCVSTVEGLERAGLVPAERRRAYQAFEGDVSVRLWDAGIRNEIAVLDESSGVIVSGVPGLLSILGDSWIGPLARLLSFAPLAALLSVAYRHIAYNRRIIASNPPGPIACACDPDFHLGYRLGFLFIVGALASLGAYALGLTVPVHGEGGEPGSGVSMWITWGAGWLAASLCALRLPFEAAITWLGHLVVTALVGMMFFVPAMLTSIALEGSAQLVVLGISGTGSLTYMTRMQLRRAKLQKLGAGWVVAWCLLLVLGSLIAFGVVH